MVYYLLIIWVALIAWVRPVSAQSALYDIWNGVLKVLTNLQDLLFGIATSLAVLMVVIGGFYYMTGGESGAKTGKNIITAAVVGLVIVLCTWIILDLIYAIAP